MIEAPEADRITPTQRKLHQQFIAGRRHMAERALKPPAPLLPTIPQANPPAKPLAPAPRDWLMVASQNKHSIHGVMAIVAHQWGIAAADIVGPCRSPPFLIARQVATVLARIHTGKSLPALGRVFRRDHTTLWHSCRKLHWLELRLRTELDLYAPVETWARRAFELAAVPKKAPRR